MRYVGRRSLVRFKKYRPHPSCPDYCAGKLRGIIENVRSRGDLPADFEVEVRVASGVTWIPAKTHVAECEHGRAFLLQPTEATRRKYNWTKIPLT